LLYREKCHRALAIAAHTCAVMLPTMLFLASLALAFVVALFWQFWTRPDAGTLGFVGRFILAWFGVVLVGLVLIGAYIVIVAESLGGW
jgi:flagellar biosynthesis protein FliQ